MFNPSAIIAGLGYIITAYQLSLGLLGTAALNAGGVPEGSMGIASGDYDNDGDEDLFIASGHVYPEASTYSIDSEYEQPPLDPGPAGEPPTCQELPRFFRRMSVAPSQFFVNRKRETKLDVVLRWSSSSFSFLFGSNQSRAERTSRMWAKIMALPFSPRSPLASDALDVYH